MHYGSGSGTGHDSRYIKSQKIKKLEANFIGKIAASDFEKAMFFSINKAFQNHHLINRDLPYVRLLMGFNAKSLVYIYFKFYFHCID
jgi:hypothetical protein